MSTNCLVVKFINDKLLKTFDYFSGKSVTESQIIQFRHVANLGQIRSSTITLKASAVQVYRLDSL